MERTTTNRRLAWVPTAERAQWLSTRVPGLMVESWAGGGLPPESQHAGFVVAPLFPPAGYFESLAELPRLEVVQLMSAGYQHVAGNVPDWAVLCNARGVHDPAVAEWVVAAMLAQLRSLPMFLMNQREHRWERQDTGTLAGARILIVGHGSIGHAVERLVRPFGARVIGVGSHARGDLRGIDELDSLLPSADILVLLLPGSSETDGTMTARRLGLLPDGALVVNAGRGTVLDSEALVAELRAGRLRAALDVAAVEPLPSSDPLWDAPNLLLTPHIASDVPQKEDRFYELVVRQVERWMRHEALDNVVRGSKPNADRAAIRSVAPHL